MNAGPNRRKGRLLWRRRRVCSCRRGSGRLQRLMLCKPVEDGAESAAAAVHGLLHLPLLARVPGAQQTAPMMLLTKWTSIILKIILGLHHITRWTNGAPALTCLTALTWDLDDGTARAPDALCGLGGLGRRGNRRHEWSARVRWGCRLRGVWRRRGAVTPAEQPGGHVRGARALLLAACRRTDRCRAGLRGTCPRAADGATLAQQPGRRLPGSSGLSRPPVQSQPAGRTSWQGQALLLLKGAGASNAGLHCGSPRVESPLWRRAAEGAGAAGVGERSGAEALLHISQGLPIALQPPLHAVLLPLQPLVRLRSGLLGALLHRRMQCFCRPGGRGTQAGPPAARRQAAGERPCV